MTPAALYRAAQRIYGICPCCGEPFRLADAALFVRAKPPKTPFDKLNEAQRRFGRRLDQFDSREQTLREHARKLGQLAAKRRLAKMVPGFVGRKIAPQDVKVLFDPVDYVVFHGMTERTCASVLLVDRPPSNRGREAIHRSLEAVIKKGNLDWETYRITDDGEVVPERRSRSRPADAR